MPSPVGPRQGHLASGAMHPPLLLLLLHFPRLSLRLWARLMHHASSLHFSYPVLRRLVYIADSAVSLSLSLYQLLPLNSRTDKLHGYSHRYPSLYPPSVLTRVSCVLRPFFAFELPRNSELSSPIGARCAPLFSFLIPLTLALFSLPLHPLPQLCRYKYPMRRYF